ncbi:MAG: PPC domain-containing protein, partial [Planctomycetota bacterium]
MATDNQDPATPAAPNTLLKYIEEAPSYALSIGQPAQPTPRPIGFGESLPGAVTALINEQLFDLEIDSADLDKPFAVVIDGDGTLRPLLEILSPSAAVLATASSGGSVFDSAVREFIPRSVANGGAGPGVYQLRVTAVTADLGAFEIGVSDRPHESPTPIGFSVYTAGYLDHTGDQDLFMFNGSAGDEITAKIESTRFDADLLLTGPNGVLTGAGHSDKRLTVTLPDTGAYTVVVSGGGAASLGNGPYLLSVSQPHPAPLPIGFGQRAAGSIHVVGDTVRYSLDVGDEHVGKPVSIVVSRVTNIAGKDTYGFDTRLRLIAPDGTTQLAAVSTGRADIYAIEIDDFILPATGVYTIEVSDDGDDHIGDFKIGVSDQPTTAPIPLPAFNKAVTGSINPIGDVDEYTVDGLAGQIITVERLSGTGLNSDIDLTLFDPGGAVIAGAGSNDGLFDRLTLPVTGQYTLRIEPLGSEGPSVSSQLGNTGGYRFVVWAPEWDPTPVPIGFGENLPGQLAVRGDIVRYSLVVAPEHVGKPVSIVVSQVSNIGGRDTYSFDTRLDLIAPDGTTQLATVTTGRADLRAVEIDDFILPAAGVYTLEVRDDGDDHTGSFTVGVSDQPVESPHPLPAFDAPIDGALNFVGDVDDYVFNGAAGQVITVEHFSGGGLNSDIDMTLFDSTGAVVAGSGSNNQLLELVTLPATDQYTLRIEPRGDQGPTVSGQLDNTGPYRIAVVRPDIDPAPVPIGFGQSLAGELAIRGDIVRYSLQVLPEHVGKPVSIVVSRVNNISGRDTYSFGAQLRLFAPDGSTVLTSVGTSRSDVYAIEIDDFVLPEVGVYTLQVSDNGNDHLGNFAVGVSDQPAESPSAVPIGSKTAGMLAPYGDVDEFLVTSNTGEQISVYVSAEADLNTDLTVLRPDGSVAASTTSGRDSALTFTPEVGVAYTLRIEPGDGTIHRELDQRGVYLLEVSDALNPAAYLVDPGTNTPLTFGAVAESTVDSASDTDAFVFDGLRGQAVRIAVATGVDRGATLRATLRLVGPGGVELANITSVNEPDLKRFVLPADGEYRIEVSGRDSDVGPFVLGLSDRPVENATPVTLNSGDKRVGSLNPLADEDAYRLDYTAGDIVNLSFKTSDKTQALRMEIYSPADTLLYVRTGATVGLSETTLHETGDYLVILTANNPFVTDYRLSYNVRPGGTPPPPDEYAGEAAGPVTDLIGSPPITLEIVEGEEPVDVPPLPTPTRGFDDLNQPLIMGQPAIGQFPSGAGSATYHFFANAGDTVQIDVESTSRFDADLQLYDDNFDLRGHTTIGNHAALADLLLHETGLYYVSVNGTGEGGFVLNASRRSDAAVTPLVLDGDGLLAALNAGSEQIYRFDLQAPVTIDLDVRTVNGDLLDTRLTLVSPSGIVRRATSGTSSIINNMHLLESGQYTAYVRPELPAGGRGAYTISLATGAPTLLTPPTPTPLGFGQTASSSIATTGDAVAYSLEVLPEHVGKPVSIVVSQVTNIGGRDTYSFDTRLRLIAPDGTTQLATVNTGRGDLQAIEIDDFVLPMAGTYLIQVSDDGDDHTGSFTVGVSDQPIESPVSLPAFNTLIDDAIDFMGDVDEFTFNGSIGQVLTFERLGGSGINVDIDLTLFDPTGAVIAGAGSDDGLFDHLTLLTSGLYTLRIEPRGDQGPRASQQLDNTGAYRFAVWMPELAPWPIPIGFGENQPGQVAVRGDYVSYSLEVSPEHVGLPVSIVVSQVSNIGGKDTYSFDTRLGLIGPDGFTLLATVYTGRGDLNAIEIDDFVLPEAGTYYIWVFDEGGDHTGAFTVGVSDQPTEPPATLPDFNTLIDDAIDFVGDVDEFVFNGAANQTVTIERFTGSGLNPDVDLTLLDPTGAVFAGSGSNDSLFDRLVLPTTGQYTLRIEPRSDNNPNANRYLDNTGAYRFAVWLPDRDPTPSPIGFGEALPGRVAVRGDIVRYSLEALPEHVGLPVSIVASQVTNIGGLDTYSFGTRLRLFAPDGVTELAGVNTGRGDLRAVEIDDFIVPEAGVYTIEVRDDGDDHTGSFTVGVSDQPIEIILNKLLATGSIVLKEGATDNPLFGPYTGTEDTMLVNNSGGERDNNYGARLDFEVDDFGAGTHERNSLIRFDMTDLRPLLVASEDFEGGATGWTDNTTTVGNAVFTEFLGRFAGTGGAQALSKTFNLSGQ